jgi:hypothetical protein
VVEQLEKLARRMMAPRVERRMVRISWIGLTFKSEANHEMGVLMGNFKEQNAQRVRVG